MPNNKTKKISERTWKVVSLIFFVYLIIILFAFIYNQIFTNAEKDIIQVISIIPLTGDTYSFFLQGLLTFSSILFGFYTIVLIQAIPRLRLFFEKYILKFSSKYRMSMLWALALVILFFVPFYYLFDSVTYSLIGLGDQGYIANVSISNNTYKNATITSYNSVNVRTIDDTFNASWYIIIDLIIYTLIELTIIETLIKHGRSIMKQHRI